MEKYALYTAKNIFQIRKNQLDAKLDRDLQNATKNYIMETKMFDGKDINFDNGKKDIKKENKDNIDLLAANIYLYTVAITRMC